MDIEKQKRFAVALREHALKNYNTGGWDILIECWDEDDLIARISDAPTYEAALANIQRELAVVDDYRSDIQGTAF